MINIDINLVLAAVCFTWNYCLFCGFISDDHSGVSQRTDIIPDTEKVDRKEGFWVKRFNDGIVIYYLNRFFWWLVLKDNPLPWHIFSLTIHVLNTYLLYLLLLPIIGHSSLYACAFWAVNPMLNQNVVWISGRPYLIGTLFALISMICWDNPIVFIPFYFLGLVTNISVALVPIIIWIIHPFNFYSNLFLSVLFIVAIPFIAWKFHMRFMNGLVIDRDNFRFKLRKLNTFAKMIVYYIWTLFVPVRMGWYHQAGFRYNQQWEKFNYLTLIGYALLLSLIFYFKLPGLWFLLGLLPLSNIFATNSFLQDRYLYFASIGIAIIISPYLYKYPELFYCVMTFYITRSYMYSRHLKNDELLYRENWRNHPKSDYAINNLAFFLIQKGKFDEARVIIEQGLNIDRTNKMLWYNLGITHAAQGNFNNDEGKLRFIRALDCWKTCLSIEPRWTKPANDLKKLIQLLVDNKVLSISPQEGGNSMEISIPNLTGVQEIIQGKNENTSNGT